MNVLASPEMVRSWFEYIPETGEFRWRPGIWANYPAGRPAGTRKRNGYINVRIGKHECGAHRLIWVWVTGEWPDRNVDHRNQVRDDNRWPNLRLATTAQNGQNHGLPRRNTSGVCGVTFNRRKRKWQVDICANGLKRRVGYFDRFEDAASARRAAELELFGEFAKAA